MQIKQQFKKETENHKMHVLLDQGIYRHLIFKGPPPNSWNLRFEIVTFPGSLVFTGDAGTYTFSRCNDMFNFFNQEEINPGYWGEKCTSEDIHSRMVEYSPEAFEDIVKYLLDDWAFDAKEQGLGEDEISLEIKKVEEDLLSYDHSFELLARQAVDEYESSEDFDIDNRSIKSFSLHDFWEQKLTKATHRYLWACHAIRWAVEEYFKSTSEDVHIKLRKAHPAPAQAAPAQTEGADEQC